MQSLQVLIYVEFTFSAIVLLSNIYWEGFEDSVAQNVMISKHVKNLSDVLTGQLCGFFKSLNICYMHILPCFSKPSPLRASNCAGSLSRKLVLVG